MTPEELSIVIEKAKNWDALEEKISEFYGDDDEADEFCLLEIGEIAASAFGFL